MFKEMNIEQLEARKTAIAVEVDNEGADLDALETEVREINSELETRKKAAEERAAKINAVMEGAGKVIEIHTTEEERKTMDILELRKSNEYVEAYANFVKTGDDKECRALMTVNALESAGTVPVPVLLEGYVREAWERNGILSQIRRSYFRGNLQIGYEKSATAAQFHQEGGSDVPEEQLVLGTVTLIAKSAKKWITISDEALDMAGAEFLRFVYDEITYKITQLLANTVVTDIVAAAGGDGPAVASVSAALALDTVVQGLAQIADAADNAVVVMNKATYAAIKSLQLAANYAVDPFDGLRVFFSNGIKSYAAAGNGDAYMIVGDFRGYQANFPNGDDIDLKFDDLSLAEKDLVKIVGRVYVGMGVVAPNHFAVITKPAG